MYIDNFFLYLRAQARLQKAREEAQRPGPEKAARIQNLHKKLRVYYISMHAIVCKGTA
jgi:hypothetical protein